MSVSFLHKVFTHSCYELYATWWDTVQHIVVNYKAVFLGRGGTAVVCVPLLFRSASGPLSQDPLPGWLGWGGGPHPEITVHFKAWINIELFTNYAGCNWVICFSPLWKNVVHMVTVDYLWQKISPTRPPHPLNTHWQCLQHMVCGNTKRDYASWKPCVEYKL